jgi:hypothetical protein
MKAWVPTPDTIRFQVVVPNGQYFSIGFGKTMTNCDMVIWEANGMNSKALDLWSTGRSVPMTDPSQDYTTTFDYNGTHVTFTSTRKLNTGDRYDYVIP